MGDRTILSIKEGNRLLSKCGIKTDKVDERIRALLQEAYLYGRDSDIISISLPVPKKPPVTPAM